MITDPIAADPALQHNPEAYEPPAPPRPLDTGTYKFKLANFFEATQFDNQDELKDPYELNVAVWIVEGPKGPLDTPRYVRRQKVSSRSFKKDDGSGRQASMISDLTETLAPGQSWTSRDELKDILTRAIGEEVVGTLRLGWQTPWDMEYIESQKVNGQVPREAWNDARLRGQQKFEMNGNNVRQHSWKGPSGNILYAENYITGFLPNRK